MLRFLGQGLGTNRTYQRFDYIEYISEYSTFTIEQFENFGRAIELFPNMSSMIKVEEQTRGFIAQRALDAGIQNILFSDCRDAKDVKECIRFVRPETPEAGGIHGAGAEADYIGSNAMEWVEAMNNVVLAFMMRKKAPWITWKRYYRSKVSNGPVRPQ